MFQVDGVTIPAAAKSKTLPEYACKYALIKHKRSLSESKTTDGISLTSNTNHYIGRTRFNSGTDSNTSGVSSYESVFGVAVSDLCKTLSPIPSSSNLLEVKKPNERFRRISLTGAHFRETTISPLDAQGYAKLRSIRRSARPQLSESAADELAEIMDSSIRPTNRLTITQSQRRLKVRSLDRHSNFELMDSDVMNDMSRITDISSMYPSNTTYARGPCYSGICLPRAIMDLFPGTRSNGTYVTRCIKDADSVDTVLKHGVVADFISECDEYSVSSLSDISSTASKRSKIAGTKHNRSTCLVCCRSTQIFNRFNSIATSTNACGSSNLSDINIDVASNSTALTTPNRKFPDTYNLETTYNSSESHLSDENYNEKIQETILRHVQRMANPVWSKQSKLALFKIKQKHPHFFRNICLYSDVCTSLSQNTYRFSSRRFLQEIFSDIDYSAFYNEAIEVVNRKKELADARSQECIQDTDTVDGELPATNSAGVPPTTSSPTLSPTTNALVEKVRSMNFITPIPSVNIITNPLKSHLLRSPPLASVYETSRENLSDSVGAHSKSILNSTPIGNDSSCIRLRTEVDIEIIPRTHSPIQNSWLTNNDNSICSGQSKDSDSIKLSSTHSDKPPIYSRPRFNTLELDLSCTKNKFPITDRRKTFDASTPISNSALYSQRIKKSLSASITTAPSMSLYCEKRLQTSKSEAILTNNNTYVRNSINFNNHGTKIDTNCQNNRIAK